MSLPLVRCVLIVRMLRLCGTVILLQRANGSNIVLLEFPFSFSFCGVVCVAASIM